MKKYLILYSTLIFSLFICGCGENGQDKPDPATADRAAKPAYALVIHGGAGVILKENMTPEREQAYLDKLNEALDIGERILRAGGTSLDAVQRTIMHMEDSELFNAGKGAVFNHEGKNEMDASIMEGKDLRAGAIGGVSNIMNPIVAARAVMEKSPHVMLTGKGAEEFARLQGIEQVDPSYFFTERRMEALKKALEADREKSVGKETGPDDRKHGTVGACALDQFGNLVAGTSTGGMTNKKWNRIGDSPVIGAGNYANNRTCAVSATGHGEFFIRYTVAHDISALMEYKGLSLQDASDEVVMDKLVDAGGSGGIVAVDREGNIAMTFNSPGMYRGYARPGERVVKIYGD